MLPLVSFVSVLISSRPYIHTLGWVLLSFKDLFFLFELKCASLLRFSLSGSALLPPAWLIRSQSYFCFCW